MNISHHNSNPQPSKVPMVLSKEKEAYQLWLFAHRNFPRIERLGLGKKIDSSFLDVLEFTFASIYLHPEQKIILLNRTIVKLDHVKFFMQLAWENKLIQTDKYTVISKSLEEIGRQLGGWKKGIESKLQTKTPTDKAGEIS